MKIANEIFYILLYQTVFGIQCVFYTCCKSQIKPAASQVLGHHVWLGATLSTAQL